MDRFTEATDFGGMDLSSYQDALGSYQDSLNSAISSVADKNASAQEKVQKFNEALQGSLGAVSAPIIAKGVGKSFANLKSAISKRAGQAAKDAEQAVKDKANELVGQARSKVENLADQVKAKVTGQKSALEEDGAKPEGDADTVTETNIDQQLDTADQVGKLSAEPEADDFSFYPDKELDPDAADIFKTGEPLDEFDPSLIPEGAGGRVNLSEAATDANDAAQEGGTEGAKAVADAGKDAAEDAGKAAASTGEEAGTEAATTAAEAGTGAAADSGLAAAGATADAAAAGEGGMNPIADLAALGIGLGMLFTGLFAKKHAHTVKPPPAALPTFSFGT